MAKELSANMGLPKNLSDSRTQAWLALHYLNLYRITLAALFVSSISIEKNLPILGSYNPQIFLYVSSTYLVISMFCSFAIRWKKPSFETLTNCLAFLDVLVLTLLMHTSGGIESGLGMLLVVAIAGSSLISEGRTASLFAAMAAIAILTEQVYSQLNTALETNYTQAGLLGITLFATAILSHVLSKRLRETEALAKQRGIDLANMAQLNEHVIKRLQSGVIVVDKSNRIRLMNESAWHMLGLPNYEAQGNPTLQSVSDELDEQMILWQHTQSRQPPIFRPSNGNMDIMPNFTRLGKDKSSGTLIFLEDSTRMAQQAQQMKLASLGRLTASIAHEIRNPLGAISHADQLLAESENLDQSDKRLTEIIHTHTARVNAIIENVLQLSRRGNATPEDIELQTWLANFVEEFILSQNLDPEVVAYSVEPQNLILHIDPTQFHQVLWNLCQNGLRYSQNYPKNPKLEIRCTVIPDTQMMTIDVIDHGSGIDPETAQQIFEPFFTTDAKGSGLGLYIAKEMCETNHGKLRYIPVPSGGSCFRIEFPNKQ